MDEEANKNKSGEIPNANVPDQNKVHQGLVSHVELSYVALGIEENTRTHKISIDSTGHSHHPDTENRHSLGQIKVRVKTYSHSQPHSEEEEEENGEGEEHAFDHGDHDGEQEFEEHETEAGEQEDNPENRKSLDGERRRPSSVRRLRASRMSQMHDKEEASFAVASLSAPLSTTKRPTYEQDVFDGENNNEDEEEQNPSDTPDDDVSLKQENIHSILLEKECVVPEMLIVWENVCKYIIQKLLEGFAVRIPGLGTVSYSVLPSDIINKPVDGKFSLRKTRKFPVFKLCPHVKEMYRLVEENHLYQCNVPTVPLNVATVATNSKLRRGLVDGFLTEILQSFATGIITNKCLEFPFPFIGKLYIRNKKAFMIFYEQFCEGLSFEFSYAPSYISSVFLGNMTPLSGHRPANGFHSVFHFGDVRSVEDKIAAKPRPYAKGKLIRGVTATGDPCEFVRQLFTHSNLLYDCSCCKPGNESSKTKDKSRHEDDDYLDENSTPPCGYSKNYDRVKRACCTQHGSFTFQKPDGSTFSPEPLFRSSKTGNPILDRMSDDRCLLQQAIGCWMKRKVFQTLGSATIAKHLDRDYFRRNLERDAKGESHSRKSYLVREEKPPTVSTTMPSPTASKGSVHTDAMMSPRRLSVGSAEDRLILEVEEGFEESDDSVSNYPQMGSINPKNIRSKSYQRPPNEVPIDNLNVEEDKRQNEESESRSAEGNGRQSVESSGKRTEDGKQNE